MNDWTCHLVIELLKDKTTYLRSRVSSTGRSGFMLYRGNQNPVKWFSSTQYYPLKELVKVDKEKRITLNLKSVRQLHGKSFIKQQYKLLNNGKSRI